MRSDVSDEPSFVLFRAVHNDVPHYHLPSQTFNSVKFIIDSEQKFTNLDRRWLLFRLLDPEEERRILELLHSHQETVVEHPLNVSLLQNISPQFDGFSDGDILRSAIFKPPQKRENVNSILRHLYEPVHDFIIAPSVAKNEMIEHAFASGASFVLPWDCDHILTPSSWKEIKDAVNMEGNASVFYVPSARVNHEGDDSWKKGSYIPDNFDEVPQVLLHNSSLLRFNESISYASDSLRAFSQDAGFPTANNILSAHQAGWVAHLEWKDSFPAAEKEVLFGYGMQDLYTRIFERNARENFGWNETTMMLYDDKQLYRNREVYRSGKSKPLNRLVANLTAQADAELERNVTYAVTDKTLTPPSGDKHHFFTWATYHWRIGGLNSTKVKRYDGHRSPGTVLYDEHSRLYDRTRLANFHRNVSILTLAGYFSGETKYFSKAVHLIRVWFLNPETRMHPSLQWSSTTAKRGKFQGTTLLEGGRLVFVYDMIKLLLREGAFSAKETDNLLDWARNMTDFVGTSRLGKSDYFKENNLAVNLDIHMASLASLTGNMHYLMRSTSLARGRLFTQYDNNGSAPRELSRHTQLFYMFYSSTMWYNLANMAEKVGIDIWSFRRQAGERESVLRKVAKFNCPYLRAPGWTHKDAGTMDMAWPVAHFFILIGQFEELDRFDDVIGTNMLPVPECVFDAEPSLSERAFTPMFWNLGSRTDYKNC